MDTYEEQIDTEATGTEQTDGSVSERVLFDGAQPGQSDLGPSAPGDTEPSPGDLLRLLPAEAEQRGTRFVSAQAMQARLFSVYDAAAAAEDALALVQHQLTLTLNRSYYEASEIETMASELDALLMLDAIDLGEEDLVSEE
jgi:hypothetical protein